MTAVVMTTMLLLEAGSIAAGPAPRATPALASFETVRVADGIYTFVAPETLALVSGNSTAIIGSDAVLVVDTGHFPSATRKMIAEIRRLTNRPVRFVVNTHWHPDHHSGNFVYREEFPDVVIISTEYTREQIEKALSRACGEPASVGSRPDSGCRATGTFNGGDSREDRRGAISQDARRE